MSKTAMKAKLMQALRLLESVPHMAHRAAHTVGANAVPFILHSKIEPFVDKTRDMLRKSSARRERR